MAKTVTGWPAPTAPACSSVQALQAFISASQTMLVNLVELANSYPPKKLMLAAYGLYERFRPEIPAGKAGWGTAGELDVEQLKELARH